MKNQCCGGVHSPQEQDAIMCTDLVVCYYIAYLESYVFNALKDRIASLEVSMRSWKRSLSAI